jgi:superfamily II DNA or RNA helicase
VPERYIPRVEKPPIPITQKLLAGAGGWPAMKMAKQLQEAGRVTDVSYVPPLLSGMVREGNRNLRSGLRIKTESDIENLCTCREAREWGKICAHALAVGLQHLAPAAAPPAISAKPIAASVRSGPTFIEAGATTATPLALHFILPPNFDSAWAKRQIMLVTEVELRGKRATPTVLLPNETYACDAIDLAAVDALQELSPMRMLSREEFLRLLRSLGGHPRVTFGKSERVEISSDIARPRLSLAQDDSGNVTLRVRVKPDERLLAAGEEMWSRSGNRFRPIAENVPAELLPLTDDALTFRGERAQRFLAFEAPRLQQWFEVEADRPLPEVHAATPTFVLQVEGSMREVRADLRAQYGESAKSVFETTEMFVRNRGALALRDAAAEQAAVGRLERFGFVRRGDRLILAKENLIARFFAFEYPRLKNDWQVQISAAAAKSASELQPLAPKLEVVSSGEDWFELRYSLATPDGQTFSAAELQRLLRSGQSQTRLRNGRTAVFDAEAITDFEEVLRDVDPRQVQPGTYRIKRAQAGYVAATAEELGSAIQRFAGDATKPPELGSLAKQLRDYQSAGVSWLWRLAHNKLGGILADEMGLGKTVQTLAFLLANRAAGPALIVCPTSLLTNWRNETQRFTPELRVLTLDGPERHARFSEIPRSDVVLTSYALLQRDSDNYRDLQFSTVVLDEAQHIKNPDTQNAQAAFALHAQHRFALTGTPIENSVRDLWSIMNFALPGYLGSRAEFRERYELPLSRGPAPEVQRRLARRMRPFLLRRKKSDVAKELPEKLEQQVVCDLTPAQRTAYDGLLREVQSGVAAEQGNAGAARMKMLLGLLRLRQVCCDLRLLDREKTKRENDSAKLALLDELLDEAIDGGHRVLLFSQFVSMLALIRERLEAKAVRFSYLDGSTKERQAVVDEFQKESGIPVFLMSLKAGGVGLNLSAADTVIHFDPWWNYAAEAQATDRAHRIGQTRVVTAYKLIARDTVEEKIVKLQARKRSASEGVIGSEEPLMSGLTTADLEELLA